LTWANRTVVRVQWSARLSGVRRRPLSESTDSLITGAESATWNALRAGALRPGSSRQRCIGARPPGARYTCCCRNQQRRASPAEAVLVTNAPGLSVRGTTRPAASRTDQQSSPTARGARHAGESSCPETNSPGAAAVCACRCGRRHLAQSGTPARQRARHARGSRGGTLARLHDEVGEPRVEDSTSASVGTRTRRLVEPRRGGDTPPRARCAGARAPAARAGAFPVEFRRSGDDRDADSPGQRVPEQRYVLFESPWGHFLASLKTALFQRPSPRRPVLTWTGRWSFRARARPGRPTERGDVAQPNPGWASTTPPQAGGDQRCAIALTALIRPLAAPSPATRTPSPPRRAPFRRPRRRSSGTPRTPSTRASRSKGSPPRCSRIGRRRCGGAG
jgi:hypothetical protein